MKDGTVLIGVGEIAKIMIVERIFHAGRDKLMTIPAFAWAYARVMALRAYLRRSRFGKRCYGRSASLKREDDACCYCQGMFQVAKARSGLAERGFAVRHGVFHDGLGQA